MAKPATMPVLPVEAYMSQAWYDLEAGPHLLPHEGFSPGRGPVPVS